MLRLQIKVRSESLGERNRAAVLGSVQDTRGVFRVSSLGLSSELACFLGHRERFRKRIKTETQQEKYERQQNCPGLGQFGQDHWECCQSGRYTLCNKVTF